ncbi:hypothetical protein CCR83_03290 [Rhodobacter veldkampii DSM 11550]|uniref:Glycosyltransferase n=1 Tax=Phaeovulum veldkampii DSM 11550 TaxID=1185920 RepID=A0A2T4JMY0_9RHOB|nr:WecB/TagA/CpsF family glycosyltransferase [Phaeovulum veldkampii]MBK5945498.1 hypothetical protein [Phaeovulum veldkampii DSM 11550]PTE19236.1 glycosyltransferase [Phaeovulum veldkampii DSM 11550]TDQ62285.1 exopolysaccharide biosynthesis WecB/TagA/CpsF family protein [Phaeovulum veldkampii DSM 11550]
MSLVELSPPLGLTLDRAFGADGAARVLTILEALRIETEAAQMPALIDALTRPAAPTVLAFVNAHAINLIWSDPDIFAAFAGADILLRDGTGTGMALRTLGRDPGLNLNGSDLIPQLLARLAGEGVAIFGTRQPWLGQAAAALRAAGLRVKAEADGFRPAAHYLDLCRKTRPPVIVLGMGMPRQERVAEVLRAGLDHPCLIICGGAILDLMGGRFARAPRAMQRLGLEWFYRLLREPARLFRRYVIGIPLFFLRLRATRLRAARP